MSTDDFNIFFFKNCILQPHNLRNLFRIGKSGFLINVIIYFQKTMAIIDFAAACYMKQTLKKR